MTSAQAPLVVHVIYALGTGGLENGLVNIINRTPAGRYRHAIICLTEAHEFAGRITAPGVQVYELHKREGQDWGMYWRLWRLLRSLRPAVLHTRNLAALDVHVLGPLLPGVKQVHGEHGRDIYDLDGSNWKYRHLRRVMRLFVDRYIAVSCDLANWLSSSIGVKPARLQQIYNGVDHQKFTPSAGQCHEVLPEAMRPREPAVIIGTVGRLVEVKDQALILRAVKRLLEQSPDWRDRLRIVIVGDGPLRASLESTAESLGLADMLWMPGDRDDVPALLQAMDVFVLPSLGEGISNTLLEAMAAGLPVLATDVGGNPELVTDGENGRLFPVADEAAFCAALQELLDDSTLRETMGHNGLRRVRERFDWNRTVADYLRVYDELLGRIEQPGQGQPGQVAMPGADDKGV